MKRTLLRFFVLLIILPGAVISALWSMEQSGFFQIDHIEIALQEVPTQPQFLQPFLLDFEKQVEAYRGQSLWQVDLYKMSKELSKLEWIEDISFSRRWPSKLKILLKPKQVYFVLLGKGGKLLPVIENGQLLPAVESKQAPDVPLLQSEVFNQDSELRKKAVTVLKEISEDGNFSRKTISEVHFDKREGFWMTLIQSGIRVNLGDDRIALKSARVSQVLDYMEAKSFSPRVIDANLSKKVLVRLRKDP